MGQGLLQRVLLMGTGTALKKGQDPREALFNALRVLQEGGTVALAPDGPMGKQSIELNVLGTKSPAGDGAAFLAYQSNCATAWCTAIRENDRFVPILEMGPRRESGESFKDFQDRFFRFYVEKIEGVLTGDPNNIALAGRWTNVLKETRPSGQ
jgi:hypothetical protein